MDATRSTENEAWLSILSAPCAVQVRELTARGLPRVGLLFVQNACESRCFFCANAGVTDPPPEALTRPEQIMRWIEDARDVPLDRVCVGGTEPALHPAFERALAALAPRSVPIEVMTSGLRLAEVGAASRWHQLGVRAVAVPLYSADATVHDAVVGAPAAFERVCRGLDSAQANGIDVFVHTLPLQRTLPGIGALAELVAERWGARLALGVSRPKDSVWSWEREAPGFDALEDAIAGLDVSVVGFPACVARDKPRAAATVIDLYFRSTETAFAPACAGCAERQHCPGVLAAELARGARVRPA